MAPFMFNLRTAAPSARKVDAERRSEHCGEPASPKGCWGLTCAFRSRAALRHFSCRLRPRLGRLTCRQHAALEREAAELKQRLADAQPEVARGA